MKPCKFALWCAEGDQFARLRGCPADPLQAPRRRAGRGARGGDRPCGQLTTRTTAPPTGLPSRSGCGRNSHRLAQIRVKGWQIRVERDAAGGRRGLRGRGRDGDVRHRRARYRLSGAASAGIDCAGL